MADQNSKSYFIWSKSNIRSFWGRIQIWCQTFKIQNGESNMVDQNAKTYFNIKNKKKH